jgi:hypothetical protein
LDKLTVLRLDGDMYESTIQELEALHHKVSPGVCVIIDDYLLELCATAMHDLLDTNNISEPMHDVDAAAFWWQVSM